MMEKISLVRRRKQATTEPAPAETSAPKLPVQQKKTARQWFEEGSACDAARGCSDKAIEAYKQSIHLDENLTDAHVNLGFAYLEKEEYEEALKCFSKVAELESENPESYNNLGYVYEKMDRLGAAKQMYERALQVRCDDVEALINIAHIADLQGDYQGALESYRSAIKASPESVSPHFCLATLYDRHDMFDEAGEE